MKKSNTISIVMFIFVAIFIASAFINPWFVLTMFAGASMMFTMFAFFIFDKLSDMGVSSEEDAIEILNYIKNVKKIDNEGMQD